MNKLIAIEGIDGAGTTTQCAAAGARTSALHVTREPSDRRHRQVPARDLARRASTCSDEVAVALLFAADRIDHVRQRDRAAR